MMYAAQKWPVRKARDRKLDVAEMKILRWMCGVTKMDKARNNIIRGTMKVVAISKKVQERRFQWYAHERRKEESYIGIRVGNVEVQDRE